MKAHLHAGQTPRLHHVRATRGAEVDLVVDRAGDRLLVEVKSGATIPSDGLDGLKTALAGGLGSAARLVHDGTSVGVRSGVELRPWASLDDAAWLMSAA